MGMRRDLIETALDAAAGKLGVFDSSDYHDGCDAPLVFECDECGAAVLNPEKHEGWHQGFTHKAISIAAFGGYRGPQGVWVSVGADGREAC